MKIAGKCPPEPGELKDTREKGFENAELYLEKHHLDNIERSIEAVENSDLGITSVHTPHVTLDSLHYFRKSDRLAAELDAFLVIHSQFLHHTHIEQIKEAIDFSADHGYENNPGAAMRYFRNAVVEQGYDAVLDVAHLYLAEENYISVLENFLQEYVDSIQIVHVCDSLQVEEGLGFGEGKMDMEKVCRTIAGSDFDGTAVLEVMPEHQKEALEKWNTYTG